MALFGKTTFHIGDTIHVHYKLIEKEKVAGKTKREVKEEVRERIQVFEGMVIAIKGMGDGKMFTVRRIGTGNIGVERIFPLISPWIKKITIKSKGKARRAKLYFLRSKSGKEAAKIIKSEKLKEDAKAEKVELETPATVPPAAQNEEPKK